MLEFRTVGYGFQKLFVSGSAGNIIIRLKAETNTMSEVEVGRRKTRKVGKGSTFIVSGDASAEIRIDEPVGAAPPVIEDLREADFNVDKSAPGYRGLTQIHSLSEPETGKHEEGNSLTGLPVRIRKNFSETAFFFPQLQTNEFGDVLINFTSPESLTKWRFQAFAHTTNLESGNFFTDVLTQKLLMVSANMPRFFREGDTIAVSARLANLTDKPLKAKVNFNLFDALTMQPVSLLADAKQAQQTVELKASSTNSVSFKLIIPQGLDAITYRITAESGKFSDGEENTVPVLPNAMLVTESMPMMVRAGQTKSFTLEKFRDTKSTTLKSKNLTLEYTENPVWYAVQALPYLMEFPYECSEQTFSRYFANATAAGIVSRFPVIKRVFERWKASDSKELLSNLETNPELKSILIEETPWLRDAQNETEQKKRIALLFDLNKMNNELKTNIEKLEKMQLPDGSFPWFSGLHSNPYITRHILAGIGQLQQLKLSGSEDKTLNKIAEKALNWLDGEIVTDYQKSKKQAKGKLAFGSGDDHTWFTRSYFNKPITGTLKAAREHYLKTASTEWKYKNIYEQGMTALTLLRYGRVETAKQIVRSLKERALQSEELGMYWPTNKSGYYWYQAPVETHALLIELFTLAGNTKDVEEMKIWLLRNKQTNNWRTTKATAAACYAILLRGDTTQLNNLTPKAVISLGGEALASLKPDLKQEAGTGYFKTAWKEEQIKPELAKVEVKNSNSTISWGALTWQYLEKLDKITSAETNIKLSRKYFIKKQKDVGQVLTELSSTNLPKPGDVLKVVVNLKADRDFEYVHLKDMRPSGTEPVDVLSGYRYQDGLYYYQVTKDVATNFFIDRLNKGNYVFEYELRVTQPGDFSTGITSVQSMYAPEFNSHSEGTMMRIGE